MEQNVKMEELPTAPNRAVAVREPRSCSSQVTAMVAGSLERGKTDRDSVAADCGRPVCVTPEFGVSLCERLWRP